MLFLWYPHIVTVLPEKKNLDLVLNSLVTTALVITAGLWLTFLRKFKHRPIVLKIKGAVIRHLQKDGKVHSLGVDNLAFLGCRARPGYEKRQILSALDDIGLAILNEKIFRFYKGNALAPVVEAIVNTVAGTHRIGGFDNFRHAFSVMNDLLEAASQRKQHSRSLENSSDIARLEQGRAQLAERLAECALVETGGRLFEAIPILLGDVKNDSDALFSVGRLCLGRYPTLGTLPALAKLLLLSEKRVSDLGVKANLLGLAALFYLNGPSAREWVLNRILEQISTDRAGLLCDLRNAREFQLDLGRFEAADALLALQEDLV